MSTPPRSAAGSPDDWLRRAKSNLLRAQQSKPDEVLWEDLCFDAQQAVEKALKALLTFHAVPYRFTHDIAALLTAVEQAAIEIPVSVRAATILTDYAVSTRYPGTAEPVTEADCIAAVTIATATVHWVEQRLKQYEVVSE